VLLLRLSRWDTEHTEKPEIHIEKAYLFNNSGKETRFLPKNLVSHQPIPGLLRGYEKALFYSVRLCEMLCEALCNNRLSSNESILFLPLCDAERLMFKEEALCLR